MSKHSIFVGATAAVLFLTLSPAATDAQVTPAAAQGGARSSVPVRATPGETAVKETTEVVTLDVTVTDREHRLVSGLGPDDFEVFENKVPQRIEYFRPADAPASVGVVFDVSGSMGGYLGRARDALSEFVGTSHPDDDFFLIGFNDQARLLAEFSDGDAVANKLTRMEANGSTALYDAVLLGIEQVRAGRHRRRALLVISDGEDNHSRHTFSQVRRALKEADVQVYCVGISGNGPGRGGLFGQLALDSLAKVTGGKAFFVVTAAELEDVTARIALELRSQYSIGYTPADPRHDGKWREIKVRVKPLAGRPRLSVRAKSGYYARGQ